MAHSRDEIIAWVGSQILPHEADVRAWLRRGSASAADIDDIVQEAYCRLAALTSVAHIQNGRAYFFQTARNIVMERIRRARVVRIEQTTENGFTDIVDSEPSPERVAVGRNELRLVEGLIEGLPDRCREIFKLRRIHRIPQREVARMLGVSENVVELQVMRGLRLILQGLSEGPAQPSRRSLPHPNDTSNGRNRGHRQGGR